MILSPIVPPYYQLTGSGLVVRHMQPSDAPYLEELQQIVFPTLSPDEWIRAEHYLHHLSIFPEGQFVIASGERRIGMTTTMRTRFDFTRYQHTFKETIAGGWMTNHDPAGSWLYGLDIGIHPDLRGQGLGRLLYRARHSIAAALQLEGQITVGMLSGYGALSAEMSAAGYFDELIKGQRIDPTISPQMAIGFQPMALIPDYVNDPVCGNYGVLLRLDICKQV